MTPLPRPSRPSVSLLCAAAVSLCLCGPTGWLHAESCGEGVEVRLGRAEALQGGVVSVEVHGLSPEAEASLTWNGRALPYWRDAPRGPLRALAGVDLEHAPGEAGLTVEAPGAAYCAASLVVKEGDFAVRRLRVPRRFVTLAPRDLARAEREAATLDALFAEATPERLWTGAFRLPLEGVEPSTNFGQKRILNGEPRSPHSGLDFGARSGTPVRAPQRGRVALVSTLFFTGQTVILDHGLGLYSLYAHLSAVAVAEGHVVEAGGRIGNVGATGRATGPHLHWSLRLAGARVNPLELVKASADAE